MEAIIELDQQLNELLRSFQATAKGLHFQHVCDLNDEKTIARQQYRGLYKIDVETAGEHSDFDSWFAWFYGEWCRPEYLNKATPSIKKKRHKAHKALKPWMPLYIGKSRNIAGRVLEHLNLSLSQPTTALKLKARTNLQTQRFHLSTLKVDVDNYDLIVPMLERAQRDVHNPIIGRQ